MQTWFVFPFVWLPLQRKCIRRNYAQVFVRKRCNFILIAKKTHLAFVRHPLWTYKYSLFNGLPLSVHTSVCPNIRLNFGWNANGRPSIPHPTCLSNMRSYLLWQNVSWRLPLRCHTVCSSWLPYRKWKVGWSNPFLFFRLDGCVHKWLLLLGFHNIYLHVHGHFLPDAIGTHQSDNRFSTWIMYCRCSRLCHWWRTEVKNVLSHWLPYCLPAIRDLPTNELICPKHWKAR